MDYTLKGAPRLRRDTDANWKAVNPVLADGEQIAIKMTDGSIRYKIGNGSSDYNSLKYFVDQNYIDSKETICDTNSKKPISFSVGGIDGDNFVVEITGGGDSTSFVESFNGRSGDVVPQSGDYTASAVGAIPTSDKGTAGGVATLGSDGKVPTAQLPNTGLMPELIVTVNAGSVITAVCGDQTVTATATDSETVMTLSRYGNWKISATIGSKKSNTVLLSVDSVKQYAVALVYVNIYGVTWDGSSTTALTRTDDSALFADPVPAVGTGAGSSPFDNCLPWSGMTKVTDGNNTLVKIPKFWVKVTHSPFKVQITDQATDGFQVSPAHRDRGDGVGERDVVYIGRYECNSSYQSRTGQSPKVNTSLSSFRSGIKALGTGYYQADFALQLTLWYLYLVEFANWNGQTKIGRGNVDSSSVINTGGTDSMTYHTGRAVGTDGNVAIQYRNIENWWGNVLEWRDGIIFSDTNICTYNNPANFVDTYNGTGATVRSNTRATTGGCIKAWGHDSSDNSFIYPNTVGGSGTTYVPDYCNYYSGVRGLFVGGYYKSGIYAGPFYLDGYNAPSNTYSHLGSRLQKLPSSA